MGVSSLWKFCIVCISPKVEMSSSSSSPLHIALLNASSSQWSLWQLTGWQVLCPQSSQASRSVSDNVQFDIHLCELLEWAGSCMQLGRVVLSGWHHTFLFCIRLSLEKGLGCTLSYPTWTFSSLKCIFGRWPSLVPSSATGNSKAFFPIAPKVHLGFWCLISLVRGSQCRTT